MSLDIETIEVAKEEAKEVIAMRDALVKLQDNKDFNKVITQDFMKDEAARLVMLKSAPSIMAKPDIAHQVECKLIAIGMLNQHLSGIFAKAEQAEKALEDYEAELDELRAEG